MKKLCTILTAVLLAVGASAQKVDPNMTETGGYGYLLSSGETADLWWAEGTYKVMKDAPLPARKAGVTIKCARNEWESFILCINAKEAIDGLTINVEGLDEGLTATVRRVDYVNVRHATDSYGKEGLWPDPLPLLEGPQSIPAGDVQPFWITVRTTDGISSGDHDFNISLSSGKLSSVIPVKLHVWNFSIPDKPGMKSMFGLNFDQVCAYNHLTSPEDQRAGFEEYMKAFRDYKLSPYNPFQFTPFKETVTGVDWSGGIFDSDNPHSGNYSYRVTDGGRTGNVCGTPKLAIPVSVPGEYTFSGFARTEAPDRRVLFTLDCYDAEGRKIRYGSRFFNEEFGDEWESFHGSFGCLDESVRSIRLSIWPCNRTPAGEEVGTLWVDDLELCGPDGKNLLVCADFEQDIDDINVSIDFSDAVPAVRKYFDEYGFTAFNLHVKGLGSGTFYNRAKGNFEGFEEGTPEYDKLFSSYITSLYEGLESLGIADKAHVYWFDEPGDNDYDFVHETNARLKKFAPKLHTFITENVFGHDISDVTDVCCVKYDLVDMDKVRSMAARGEESWSYLCCSPQYPWLSEFIDHDAVNFRMWLWGSYVQNLKGVLIWTTTWWNSPTASDDGSYQDPYDEAMSWCSGYGTPYGYPSRWGNGDGRLFYPQGDANDKNAAPIVETPIPSLRLELMRDGMEDYEYLTLLEALTDPSSAKGRSALAKRSRKLLDIPETIFKDGQTYNKDPQVLLQYRERLAKAIEALSAR